MVSQGIVDVIDGSDLVAIHSRRRPKSTRFSKTFNFFSFPCKSWHNAVNEINSLSALRTTLHNNKIWMAFLLPGACDRGTSCLGKLSECHCWDFSRFDKRLISVRSNHFIRGSFRCLNYCNQRIELKFNLFCAKSFESCRVWRETGLLKGGKFQELLTTEDWVL